MTRLRLPWSPVRVRAPAGVTSRAGRGILAHEAFNRYSWLVVPFGIAVASRIYSTVLLHLVARHLGRLPSLRGMPIRSASLAWDSEWYISIAQRGYHAVALQLGGPGGHHDYAFFPLWPLVIRLGTLGILPATRVAVPLAMGLFVLAAVLIAELLAASFGREVATSAVLLLSFSPAAFTFSMAYSEPLFLVLAALALRESRPGRRALGVAAACAARISGLALLAVEGVRFVRSCGRDRGALLVGLAGVAGFAAWWAFVAAISGDPLGVLHGSPSWGTATGIPAIGATLRSPRANLVADLAFGLLILGGAIVAFRRDRLLGVYAVAAMALALLPGAFVSSIPRYALVAFPAFGGLASVVGRRGVVLLALVFAIAQVGAVMVSFSVPHASPP